MKISDQLQILSQIVQFSIFIYFAIILIQTNPLDIINLLISGLGMIISLIITIIGALEKIRER